MNYLWAGMILIGIIFGAFNGRMEVITNAALDSSKEAVTLCITMIGIMSFWCGIMEIAAQAGIIGSAAKKMRPVIRFLFPDLPKEHKAQEHITTNFIANILGLGWAKREPGGNRRRGDFSYGGKYGGCSHILQNSGAKAKEIWYNQGEQISGKEQEICIKNSMCKIVSAADSTGV